MTRAWGAALALALAVVGEMSPAVAQGPVPPSMLEQIHIALDYRGAPGCREGEVFEQALRSRVYRWDVWGRPAPWRLVLTVTPEDGGYHGEAVLWDLNDAVSAWRSTWGDVPPAVELREAAAA
jgi:hypothetical protein